MARTRAGGSLAKESEGELDWKASQCGQKDLLGRMDGRKRDCSTLIGRTPVKVKPARKRKETEKHRLYHCPEWYEVRQEIPEVFRKLEQKARTSKKEWKWQRGIVEHPLSRSQWKRGPV